MANKIIKEIMESFGFKFNENNACFENLTDEKIHFSILSEIKKEAQQELITKLKDRDIFGDEIRISLDELDKISNN